MFVCSLEEFHRILCVAIERLLEHESQINQINYYPVSDKDTGTNLVATLHPVLAYNFSAQTVAEYFRDIADIIFSRARGNSGVLFSIWFSGLSESNDTESIIDYHTLTSLFKLGKEKVHRDVEHIQPGSMLTYLCQISALFDQHLPLDTITQLLEDYLDHTKDENPILKKHQVVDAGAMGVYLLLKTCLQYLSGTKQLTLEQPSPILQSLHLTTNQQHELDKEPTYRYCAEAILKLDSQQHDIARTIIKKYGDCALFQSQQNKMKFHVHANETQQLFQELMSFSDIENPKVDDMVAQFYTIQSNKSIALVTDSSADLPTSWFKKYQIHQLPISISLGDSQALDRLTIDKSYLYDNLSRFSCYPTTAAPNLNNSNNLLLFLSKHHSHVLVITISDKMSSTYRNISLLASKIKNVTVFNSQKNSGAHGLMVLHAAEMITRGNNIEQIIDSLTKDRQRYKIYVSINQTDAMIRSGRIHRAIGSLINLLHIKPIAGIDQHGQGIILTKTFSREKAFYKLVKMLSKHHNESKVLRYAVLHVNDQEAADMLSSKLSDAIGFSPCFIEPASTVIGIHAGVGAVAVAFELGKSTC